MFAVAFLICLGELRVAQDETVAKLCDEISFELAQPFSPAHQKRLLAIKRLLDQRIQSLRKRD
jgi:hypothetical protein